MSWARAFVIPSSTSRFNHKLAGSVSPAGGGCFPAHSAIADTDVWPQRQISPFTISTVASQSSMSLQTNLLSILAGNLHDGLQTTAHVSRISITIGACGESDSKDIQSPQYSSGSTPEQTNESACEKRGFIDDVQRYLGHELGKSLKRSLNDTILGK
eukprot:CAMPEP_0203780760 /NCGR_PEP_ID=MMETSP0099_2-20121227/9695_1 /ASSEMBLY_ACC=CAM_ASM_000209 /TAXON_ID=96639 /ORGANISM=" , Strain NY0313808BC1" /LENGTH=156 /DNA_ID=CAMNT_0050681343 /DNA_START=302 /DNA_END=772 /DNA_ORIENTATION=+